MIGLLVPLIIIGVVVWIVHTQRQNATTSGRAVPSLRRALQYAGLLASLTAASIGAGNLLMAALTGGRIAGDLTDQIALGLALLLVAGPVWLLLWRSVLGNLRRDPSERASGGWGLYLVVTMTAGLIVALVNLVRLGTMLLQVEAFTPGPLAAALVALPVWGAHLWLERHPTLAPTSRLPALGVLAGSAVGLVALAVGVGTILGYALDAFYGLLPDAAMVGSDPAVLLVGLVVAVVAVPVWWWHWLHQGVGATRDTLWHAYVLLVAIFGGLVTAVTASGLVLGTALQWLIGEPSAARAAAHFMGVPTATAAALVGVAIWRYHRTVLDAAAAGMRTEPERTYNYLAAGVGLVTAAAGATVAVAAAIQLLVPGALAIEAGGRNTLATSLTLLVVGLPVWWGFWRSLQGHVTAGVEGERASPSRRVYLFLLFGATGLTAVVSLSVMLYAVFRDLLESALTVTVLHDLRVAIGLVLTAGGLSAYHWMVHRGDRTEAATSAPVPTHPRRVLLVGPDGRQFAAAVATDTGARVRSLHRLDTARTDVDAHRVAEAILAVHHDNVVVTIEEDGEVHVIPYEPA
jgi:hypothetical protein